MASTVYQVNGMTCQHCVQTVKQAVGALDGVTHVDVDLVGSIVKVEHTPGQPTPTAVKAALAAQGYEAELAP